MDTYLPADFHRLHATAAEDWRDASTAPPQPLPTNPSERLQARCDGERVVDPGWVAI